MKPPSYKVSACIALLSAVVALSARQWSAAGSALFSAYLLLRLHKADTLLREAYEYYKENEAKKSAPHV